MPTTSYNVSGLKKLRATWRSFGGERAVVVLAGTLDPADVEKLVNFLRTILQANDYRIFVDPSGIEVDDPVGTVFAVLKPFVVTGRLLPVDVCLGSFWVDSPYLSWKESQVDYTRVER